MPDYTIKLEQELPSKTDIAGTDEVRIVGGVNGVSYKNKLSDFIGYFADMLYPVGSYYDTSDPSFDPNVAWGGVWNRVRDGRTLIAESDTYEAGTNYGAETKSYTPAGTIGGTTLTAAQSGVPAHLHVVPKHGHVFNKPSATLPTHKHGFTNPSVTGGATTAGSGGGHTGHLDFRIIEGPEYMITGWGGNLSAAPYDDVSVAKFTMTMTTPSYKRVQRVTMSTPAHQHSVPAHTHTASGGDVQYSGALTVTVSGGSVSDKDAFNTNNNTAQNASQAHTHTLTGTDSDINVMQPSTAVYRWHRIA